MLHICGLGSTYLWVDSWASVPETESASTGWAHHGIAVDEAEEIIAFHPGIPAVLGFDREGNLLRSWDCDLTEGHGITLVKEMGSEHLWLADPERKRRKEYNYQYPNTSTPISGKVIKTTLDGQTVMSLPAPDMPVYQEANYCPTSVAVNDERFGGNGDIWVADGYGQSYVHQYDKRGNYLGSISGEEGEAGRFNCPHGIWIDRRRSEPELYIADRSNRRVQVYDLEGRFKRAFGSGFLSSPSAFAVDQDMLIVAELRARFAILDLNDNLVCYLGDNGGVADTAGWPNASGHLITPGKFNSPHGIAVDRKGNLYVAEWLIGGRTTKLLKD